MNFLKKILYGFLILFVLLSGFIIVCAMKPELSGQIADTLKLDEIGKSPYSAGSGFSGSQNGDVVSVSDNRVQDISITEIPDSTPTRTPAYETRPSGVIWADEREDDNKQTVDPSLFGITVPDNVSGKNGYEPVKGENSEVDDEEAEHLRSELSTGDTGDSLTFDSRFYPYYYMLDAKGQHMYRQIYANANRVNGRFAPVENVNVSELKDAFAAVYNDHPELFWVDTAYACKYSRSGQCVEIDLQFNYTADNLSSEKTSFNSKAREIIDEANKLESDYEKEKYVHDQLISKVDYVSYANINQSAYSALVNGRTVCAGYARAFQYMLQQLKIPCYYCTGYAGESHAWNIVALDDGYYNVDATWDDTGEGTYDYFNKSDADFSWNHLRQELSVYLPPCNGTAYKNLEKSDGETNDNNNDDNNNNNDNDNSDDNNNDEDYDSKRSVADVGFSKENAVSSLDMYYNGCHLNMLSKGRGNYSFSILLSGTKLFEDVYGAYQNNDYRRGYMDKTLSELNGSLYRINWQIEALQDDYYLVTHDVAIQ